jgi:O-acetyl-ADP-ribose deacetylase (regulator of RNase III)
MPKKKTRTAGRERLTGEVPVRSRCNHLLAIAIDGYQHLPRLSNCVRDVEGLIEVLHREYTFEKENIHTLYNEEATGEKIIETLEELPGQIDPEDNLLLLFSGHGEYRDLQEAGFWVPVDARPGVTRDLISIADIKIFLNPLTCHHLVMIIDACYSGSIFKRTRSTGPSKLLTKDPSRWGLTSGRLHPVLDGQPGTHSPFANSMIKQLKSNWEPLRADQLYSHIIDDLGKLGFKEQAPDCGYLDLRGDKRGMFYFTPRPERLRPGRSEDLSFTIGGTVFRIIYGDIVKVKADAVVSSDDTRLTMSGGVAKAICDAAGAELRPFIQKQVELPVRVGDVVETAAFNLASHYIFHAVTLDADSREPADPETVAAMTRRCLELADERQLKHIAFPAIGTGTAGIDYEGVAQAMVDAICGYLLGETQINTVTLTLFAGEAKERKKGLEAFYTRAIRKGAAWTRLQKYLAELPELLRELDKEKWVEAVVTLKGKILE